MHNICLKVPYGAFSFARTGGRYKKPGQFTHLKTEV
nr:MAG TPA: hypothetical protein [Caudoviricetes sp.]DAZ69939.1 MAG TPA: hypothetical protein [Caudoviricetes sp.]